MTLAFWMFPLLLASGFLAGLIDSMAGGGGLISLPVLLALGFPAPLALGTNKLQGSFGSVTATVHYARGKAVDLRACWFGIIITAAGAAIGAWCVQRLDSQFLGKLIPWLLLAIVVYLVARPTLGRTERPARLSSNPFYLLSGFALGFYDGFFGPGVGSFWTVAFVVLLGYNYVRATAHAKVMNATSNVVALVLFAFKGQVALGAGLTMAAGQYLGARLGARLVLTRGSRFVQPLFLTMVVLTVARLVWMNYLR